MSCHNGGRRTPKESDAGQPVHWLQVRHDAVKSRFRRAFHPCASRRGIRSRLDWNSRLDSIANPPRSSKCRRRLSHRKREPPGLPSGRARCCLQPRAMRRGGGLLSQVPFSSVNAPLRMVGSANAHSAPPFLLRQGFDHRRVLRGGYEPFYDSRVEFSPVIAILH